MGFRPGIAIFLNGDIVNVGMYKNWGYKDLFFESIVLACVFSKCKSVYDVKKLTESNDYFLYQIDPDEYREEQAVREKIITECLEYTVFIDLNDRYIGTDKDRDSAEKTPAFMQFVREVFPDKYPGTSKTDNIDDGDYCDALDNFYIPFDILDADGILDAFGKSDKLKKYISADTKRILVKSAECKNDCRNQTVTESGRAVKHDVKRIL